MSGDVAFRHFQTNWEVPIGITFSHISMQCAKKTYCYLSHISLKTMINNNQVDISWSFHDQRITTTFTVTEKNKNDPLRSWRKTPGGFSTAPPGLGIGPAPGRYIWIDPARRCSKRGQSAAMARKATRALKLGLVKNKVCFKGTHVYCYLKIFIFVFLTKIW